MKEEATLKHKYNITLISVGIVVVILLSAILFTLTKDKSATPGTEENGAVENETNASGIKIIPLINNTDKVVILNDVMDLDKSNDRHKTISGRVQNTGDVRALSVEITALLYDLNGTQVGKQIIRPLFNDLNPDQISYFEINVYDYVTATYRLSVSSK